MFSLVIRCLSEYTHRLIFVYVPFLNTRSVFRRRALTGASRFSCVLLGGFDSLQYFVVRRFFSTLSAV